MEVVGGWAVGLAGRGAVKRREVVEVEVEGWAAVEVEVGMAAVRLVARVVEGRSGVRVLRVAAAAAVRAAGRLAAGMAGLADRVAVRRVVMVVASACVIV